MDCMRLWNGRTGDVQWNVQYSIVKIKKAARMFVVREQRSVDGFRIRNGQRE